MLLLSSFYYQTILCTILVPYVPHDDDDDLEMQDAVEEDDGPTDPIDIVRGMNKKEHEVGHPNNNFYIIPEQIIKRRNSINDATCHQDNYTSARKTIDELVSHENICTNIKYSSVVWKITPFHSGVQDTVKEIREKE